MQRSLINRPSETSDAVRLTRSSPTMASPVFSNGQDNRKLVEALMEARIYQEYSQTFTGMTGLPLTLVPSSATATNHSIKLMPGLRLSKGIAVNGINGRSPADSKPAADGTTPNLPGHVAFNPGYTTVPVNVKNRLVGYLQTGLMFSQKPTAEQFDEFVRLVEAGNATVSREELRNAFFAAAVLPQKTQDSAYKLLTILAQHLGMLGGEVFNQPRTAEPSVINRARAYIREHLTEKIYLAQVAQVVNLNPFYFCKIFKRITGLNFTDYVARLRIEKSKTLLANREMPITDVAFASGFHSLTHFNRVFKKLTGLSPTSFRAQIITD